MCKLRMPGIGLDTGAKFLGHGKACRVFDIAAKERPRPADGGLALVHATAAALMKKYAVAVVAAADFKLAAYALAVLFCHLFWRQLHVGGQSNHVGGAHNNAAPAFAAVAAHAAVEN